MGEAKRRQLNDTNFGKTILVSSEAVIEQFIGDGDSLVAMLSMCEMAMSSKGKEGITALIPVNAEAMKLEFVEPNQIADTNVKKFLRGCVFPQVRAFILWTQGEQCTWFAMESEEVERLRSHLTARLEKN
jgi:hypothetical protein